MARPAALLPIEPMVALGLALATALGAAAVAGAEPKYKLAALLAVAGSAVLAARPDRRIACVVLWILIHPLSVERVFPIDAAVARLFIDPDIVINASDGPLALLALFLVIETLQSGKLAFAWSRLASVLLLFLLWSGASYAVHAVWLRDGFTTSAPMALLQDVRLLVFVVLIQSAVRTRGEVILALLAVAGALAIQAMFVGLSYTTGHLFSYAAATLGNDANTGLATIAVSGEAALVRATGTVGQTNEQAAFHAFMTILLIAFFAARNGVVRWLGLGVIAASALALVLTFSRGAWMSFPFGLAVCGAIAWRRRMVGRTAVRIGTFTALAMAAMLVVLGQPIYERLAYADDGATDSRLRMLGLAADMFSTTPLIGVGPGEYAEAAVRMFPPRYESPHFIRASSLPSAPAPTIGRLDIDQTIVGGKRLRIPLPVHNKYMLTLTELGVVGLLIWLWFYAEFIRVGWRCSRSRDRLLQLLGIAGVGIAAAQLLYMMVDLFDQDKPLEFMLFIPALLVAASRLAQPGRPGGAA